MTGGHGAGESPDQAGTIDAGVPTREGAAGGGATPPPAAGDLFQGMDEGAERDAVDLAAADPAHNGAGHRARLRGRLIDGGPDALLDHELIEYLLSLVIPRRDTKPLAKELLHRFGGIGPLLCADTEALRRAGLTDGMIGAIRIAQVSAQRLLKSAIANRPVLSSWSAIMDYLHADMAHQPIERFRVLFMNTRNMLIRDELFAEGSVDQVAVHVREVIRRALDLGAVSLVLVHNHPSGESQPSKADIDLTRQVVDAGRHLAITVHDHIIVGSNGHCSLRSMGLM